LASIIFLHMGI